MEQVTSAERRRVDATDGRVGGPVRRLEFVDALRGIAASLVVIDHIGYVAWPAFHHFTDHVVNIGQLGVIVFFLCSGFVIPAALERDGTRVFWVRRFFRLYPLFWLSLIGAALLAYTGTASNGSLSARDWLANITMVPLALRAHPALPVYWTLTYEMTFYVLITAFALARLSHMSVQAALITSGACALVALGAPEPAGAEFNGAPFWIATLLVGTVLYRWFAGQVRTRSAVICVLAAQTAGVLYLLANLYGQTRPSGIGMGHFWPAVSAWTGSYAVFLLALALRARRLGWLALLGTISYSLYVLHPIVLVTIPLPASPVLAVVVGFAASVVVSAVTYRYVERPAIDLGRRVASRARGRHLERLAQVGARDRDPLVVANEAP